MHKNEACLEVLPLAVEQDPADWTGPVFIPVHVEMSVESVHIIANSVASVKEDLTN